MTSWEVVNDLYLFGLQEYREIGGVVFAQTRNTHLITADDFQNVVTKNKELPADALRECVIDFEL